MKPNFFCLCLLIFDEVASTQTSGFGYASSTYGCTPAQKEHSLHGAVCCLSSSCSQVAALAVPAVYVMLQGQLMQHTWLSCTCASFFLILCFFCSLDGWQAGSGCCMVQSGTVT